MGQNQVSNSQQVAQVEKLNTLFYYENQDRLCFFFS